MLLARKNCTFQSGIAYIIIVQVSLIFVYIKAELLREGIIFLIHLFARAILLMKKLERKNLAHFYYISFKS